MEDKTGDKTGNETESGTWYAVYELGWKPTTVRVDNLPDGVLVDTVTGEKFRAQAASVQIPMKPVSLRTFRFYESSERM
ncbi:MAG: hypothetical protein Q4C70_13995 [Planctomycetia bacterium]|nr:hypothetical protein [Planctomycetia bacterium]